MTQSTSDDAPRVLNAESLAMIAQLKARLIDLEQAVAAAPVALAGFPERIDALDDQAYLLQLEAEKAASRSQANAQPQVVEEEQIAEDGSARKVVRLKEVSDEEWGSPRPVKEEAQRVFSDTKVGPVTITADMKESMRSGAHAAAEVVRDGREIVVELTDTVGDLKDLFGLRGSRRR